MRDFRNLKLPPLPGTEQESKALAAQASRWNWEAVVHLGPDATEAALQAVESPYILHLATHGFFLPEEKPKEHSPFEEFGQFASLRGVGGIRPSTAAGSATTGGMETMTLNPFQPRFVLKNPMQRSGLALAGAMTTLAAWQRGETPDAANDGIVTAAEVGTLKLEGTWLVVLSACDTGSGEARTGEGVLGLRRGFIMAGAQNLLMTLWPVADEETAKFMAAFYEAAHQTGNAPQALADVQRDWLVRLRQERGLSAAIRLAGPFILSSQGTDQAMVP